MGRAISLIKTAINVKQFTVDITSSSRPIKNKLQAVTITTMFINDNNTACANSVSVALVILLLLSQMNNSVSGKPLLPKSQEEKLSYFHSTDPDIYTHLILERLCFKQYFITLII